MNRNGTRPILLNRSQWVYLSAILFVVLPAVLCIAFIDRIHDSYLHEFVAPKLQREFGFTTDRQRIIEGKESYEVFTILSVTPGGILDRAGFRSGDIPVGYQHGFESGFYQDLRWARDGKPRAIWLTNMSDAGSAKWHWRKVTLRYLP